MGSPVRRRISRSVEAAALSRRYRLYAWFAGVRDSRRRIAIEEADSGRAADTGCLAQIRAAAAETEQRLLRGLWEDNDRLIVELHTLAEATVHHGDVLGVHDTVHHKRFLADLWTWTAAVEATGREVREVVAVAERLASGYWDELQHRPARLRRAPIVAVEPWSRPLDLIPELLAPSRLANPRSVIDRAVSIVAAPLPP